MHTARAMGAGHVRDMSLAAHAISIGNALQDDTQTHVAAKMTSEEWVKIVDPIEGDYWTTIEVENLTLSANPVVETEDESKES